MRYQSTITSKGTITIPAPLRKALGVKTGQKVSLSLNTGGKGVLIDTGITMEQFESIRETMLSKYPKRKPLTGKALKEAAAKAWASNEK